LFKIFNHEKNVDQNYDETSFHPIRMDIIKKINIIMNIGKDVDNVNWYSHYGNQFGNSSKNWK
jgi:hypothetical protein